MGYPDRLLQRDEKVVEHLHPHWLTLVPATFWFFVICVAAGFGIGFTPNGVAHWPLIVAILVAAVLLLIWLAFAPWIEWRTTHYVFTTHRVLIRRGVLRHTGRDISLQRINDVAFTQSLWDRIVKAGTLTIESAGEHGQETLHNIPRSEQQQQLLNRLIEEDENRRRGGQGGGFPAGGFPQQGFPQQGFPQQGGTYPTQQYSQPYPPQS